MNTLEEICASRLKQVAENKSLYPVALLEKGIFYQATPVSLNHYLLREDKSGIIAEFKRKSPSKGIINAYAGVKETTISYMQGGASALSVLTEPSFFGGKDADLSEARKANYCPILRKDFIVDEYQIIEARSIGADAILLIAAVLDKAQLATLHSTARNLGLEVLIEVHGKEELDKLPSGEFILGVNNRNLKSMDVDLQTSRDIAKLLGSQYTKVSESGLKSPEQVMELKGLGYQGFLIGEAFMQSSQPGAELARFVNAMKSQA